MLSRLNTHMPVNNQKQNNIGEKGGKYHTIRNNKFQLTNIQ